ncbi:MAG: hypothetical protein HY343_12310 [Lentisphaerae bacterium]|nr:hypothetical protein [Lentisphaerota bacterium]
MDKDESVIYEEKDVQFYAQSVFATGTTSVLITNKRIVETRRGYTVLTKYREPWILFIMCIPGMCRNKDQSRIYIDVSKPGETVLSIRVGWMPLFRTNELRYKLKGTNAGAVLRNCFRVKGVYSEGSR